MPIDWNTIAAPTVGEEMLGLMHEIFSIPRSLTGEGNRATLAALARDLPLEVVETPSGTKVFDWVVPPEWTIRSAWIETPNGQRIANFADSPLHVLGYSAPVDRTVDLEELRAHIFTHPEDPDLVPYRTSYWEERWGFCMSRREVETLEPGDYRVAIDSMIEAGSLTSGEIRLQGSSDREFLLSTYICHPSLANDNLSGVALLWAIAKALLEQPELRYTYRFLWSPGTLGPLCWLARNLETLDRIDHGLVTSCVGDAGPLRYKSSRRADAPVDRAARHVVTGTPGGLFGPWEPLGGDERQFCSPGFNLPVGTLTRTPHGKFPEYHSSGDNLDLVTAKSLSGAFRAALEIIDAVETNRRYMNCSPFGEPQLGRRGLYQSVPDGTNPEAPLLWTLSLSDGETDLLAIADRAGLPFRKIRDAALELERHGLLQQVS